MSPLRPKYLLLLTAAFLLAVILAAPLFFLPIRALGPVLEPACSGSVDLESLQRIELNSADEEQLCALPGVGPKRAQAILDYRRRNGGFASMEELRQVDGLSEKLIRSWKGLAWVDPVL